MAAVIDGCSFEFTGPHTDIPVYTSGYAVISPLSAGGLVSSVPCGEFEVSYISVLSVHGIGASPTTSPTSQTAFANASSLSYSGSPTIPSSGSPTSQSVLSNPPSYIMPHQSKNPTSLGVYCPLASACTALLTGANADPYQEYRSYNFTGSYTGTADPTFPATGLTGCYAGTGGLTTFTVGPKPYSPNLTSFHSITRASEGDVVTMACTDFNALEVVPFSVASSFERNPVCTSYFAYALAHNKSQIPPGVFNSAGYGNWACCGGCAYLSLPPMKVMYFSTASYDGCSAVDSPITARPGDYGKHAVVDGSTL